MTIEQIIMSAFSIIFSYFLIMNVIDVFKYSNKDKINDVISLINKEETQLAGGRVIWTLIFFLIGMFGFKLMGYY